MSTATAGRAREYHVRDELAAHGWTFVMRAAASKGAADLLLGHPDRGALLVQVGTPSKSLGPADRRRFLEAARAVRGTPVVAIRGDRKPTRWLLVGEGPQSTWETWHPVA